MHVSLPVLGDAERGEVWRGLARAVEGEVRLDRHDRMLYATDASIYQVEPLAVVIPTSVDDAARALEHCAAHGLPILPRGGGTSLAGQCTNRAVVIDLSPRCSRLVEIDAPGRRCRVEPGITIDDLNAKLEATGLFFAPDPATTRQACVGGCIGNNAAGARSIMFGRTSENIEAIDAAVIRADRTLRRVAFHGGAAKRDPVTLELTRGVCDIVARHERLIRDRFPKTIRRNAGYGLDVVLAQMDSAGPGADAEAIWDHVNLAPFLCGTEGTLAVTLGATLKLHPIPPRKAMAVIGYPSVDAAIEAVGPILRTSPSAVELLDDLIISLAKANAEYSRYVDLLPRAGGSTPEAVLYVEYFASGEADVAECLAKVRAVAGSEAIAWITDAPSMQSAWKLRKAGEPLLHGIPGNRKPLTFIEDNAVPPERLGEFVRRLRAIVESHGTRASFWAHASVGVLHVRPLLDLHDPTDESRMHDIAARAADLAKELGGVMSGEHGDGRVRGPMLERYFGPELMRAFREVKGLFDPRGLLNPGNIVEPGPISSISERTRIRPEGELIRARANQTHFEFRDQHGLGGAVEMCNGAGVCRKRSGGTMCPSYMATLDERHSTRGRANALRLAITGQLGDQQRWTDEQTKRTLDLCLSCKACKAECPSNVDIARLKAEYAAQRHDLEGVPLRARIMGNIRVLNQLGSMMPSLANWASGLAPAREIARRALGVHPKRSLPRFAKPLRRSWPRLPERDADPRPVVGVMADCFTAYNEPEIGLATARVLEALGYRPELIDAGCCGRAMISLGMLAEARARADEALGRLLPVIGDPRVRAIVACEPSCLSAIKDDWLDLRLATSLDNRKALAARCWLAEEFVDRAWDDHPRRPSARERVEVTLHAHCHQKALWGAETSAGALRRVGTVRVLDSGCCGMAGAFGFGEGTYDLSMRVAELSLAPAVRSSPRAMFAAPGTSCRHQILDATGRHALHPIQVVERALCPKS